MKKFTILTLLIIASRLLSFGQLPNITASEIKYWVGSGINEAILVMYFPEDEDNAYAWGYRWNTGSITLEKLLIDLETADSRLNLVGVPGSYMSEAYYDDPVNGRDNFGDQCYMGWVNTHGAIQSVSLTNGDIVGWRCFSLSKDWNMVNVIPVDDPNPAPTNTYTIHSGFGGEYVYYTFGTISYVGDSTVAEGSEITYHFTPDPGYHVGSVTLGGVEKIQEIINNSYTVSNITQDDTLWVLFAVDKNNTITTNDIVYWIGEGSNEVIFAVNWCSPKIAFAWGYRFDDEKVLVSKVMEDIQKADFRFNYTDGGGYITEIMYKDNTHDLTLTGDYWMYNVNEGYANGIDYQYVFNGDIIEFGDESCGLSDDFWTYVWETTITPVSAYVPIYYTIHAGFGDEWAYDTFGSISPQGDSTVVKGSKITYHFTPNEGYHVGSVTLGGIQKIQDVVDNSYTVSVTQDDTLWVLFGVDKNNTITTNDIVYWIGEGSNEAIFAVNWCDPEIAFAWGYRFEGEKVLVSKVMEDIKTADSRFDYVVDAGGYITDITYNDDNYDLGISDGEYWGYNVNEEPAAVIGSQYIFNNDIIEFGITACGLLDDFWTNAWTIEITPVSDPSVSITSLQQSAINTSIYPNPANDYTYLSINGINGTVSMQILDINGKLIQSEQFHVTNNTVKQIKISSFAKGMYFIQLQSNNITQTHKLIVY